MIDPSDGRQMAHRLDRWSTQMAEAGNAQEVTTVGRASSTPVMQYGDIDLFGDR